MLYLVRHGKAGTRESFGGDDDTLRPLTKPGERQATALARRLAKHGATALVSSPYVRCVQTLEPLAELLAAPVGTDERLAEGASLGDTLDLFVEVADGAVLCSHGDVIGDVMNALVCRGCELTSPPDWRKGTTWVLRREADGTITSAKCWPPPDA